MASLFTRRSHTPSVTVGDAARAAEGTVLVDVREPQEWAAGHAPNAVHVPLGQLHVDRIPDATTLYVVCRSGNRSGRAVQALREAGYNAYNVTGGMLAWADAGLEIVRDDGRRGAVA